MRYYTEEECEGWLQRHNRKRPETVRGLSSMHCPYPTERFAYFSLARWMASCLTFRRPTLLWITEWGIWPSSENWHLYHKLRGSYGDQRLLWEAPGHYFLNYETEDLASFLQLAMLNGWGGYVLTEAPYVNAVFSHDEYFDFYAENDADLDELRRFLTPESDERD